MRIILSGATALTALRSGSMAAQDSVAVVRRLSATTHLAAEEYRLGIAAGRVVQPEEVAEARLFLQEARRTAAKLPAPEVSRTLAELAAIQALVERTGPPDSVSAAVGRLLGGLAGRLRVELDEIPPVAPSLARGAEIYQRACTSCHGATGRGDGALAAGLKPPPANLADPTLLQDASPLDFYRRITIGVAGTSMPPAEGTLSAEDRWAVAAYASLLRLPGPRGDVPAGLAAFPSTARMSDRALREALGPGADLSRVAAVRMVQADQAAAGGRDYRPVFVRVRRLLDSAFALAQQGRGEDASSVAMDGYIVFEQVERDLGVKDAALVAEIEAAFAGVRDQAGRGSAAAAAPALGEVRARLAAALERAERTVGDTLPPLALFGQSFLILLREGLEAILLVGALIAFVVKTGAARRRRDIHIGVAAAVGMSLLTAAAIETLFRLEPAHQEALEGVTLVAATLVLFYVSYWLISRMEVARWNQFVRGKVADALGRRSGFALASVAFLAVYREGFETVLFYKALTLSGGRGPAWVPIAGGIAVGSLVLAAVYLAINRFGVRLPLKPFFAVTGGFLYYMAFSFAGKAVAELQEGRLLRLTPVPGGPRVPALGIYPTVESLLVQGALLLLALVALAWLFLVEPRRRARAAAGELPAARRGGAPGQDQQLVRSLDRIEADLAEVRSELERMRSVVEQGREVPSERDG